MTDYRVSSEATVASNFRGVLRTRDIFFHDGLELRRISVSWRAKLAASLVAGLLLLWSVFATLHMILGPSQAAVGYQGQGGPFEAVAPVKAGNPSFRQIFLSWKKLDQVERGTIAIPSAMPVNASTDFTSGFGVRSDPFRGRAAMHAGVDLAGPHGTPIYATADGIVGRSKWVNGYGNLVEINHGSGIQTRYGHLSRSLVRAGEPVRRGQLIALMGSTGRSTGNHLHYEVRIAGKAVNPVPFMYGNDTLLALQRRLNPAQIAMGGPADGGK
jgi:murein DD-endopeptidase MepM/ murein hydrolase activator NlpD